MDILAVQQRFLDAGFQFKEHVSNDGHPNNCYVQFSRCCNPHHFSECNCGLQVHKVGWGRFSRHDAWRQAAEWIDQHYPA